MAGDITSFEPGSGRRVTPRSFLSSDAATLDLSGTWRFTWSPSAEAAPTLAHTVDFDDSGWDDIAIPGHWVLQGRVDWGSPIYTNVNYPFPVEPPHVPDENPTGDHRLRFTLPDGFLSEGGRAHLRFQGVESLCIASLNGQRVGVVRGSRLVSELDVTDELVAGENLLHLRVHQWSAHSYLEDQDQWWLPGVFREVELVARPVAGIDDVWLRADYDPLTREGTLFPELRADDSAYPITVKVLELGLSHVFRSPSDVKSIPVGAVEPWSADVPRLFDAQVSNAVETRKLRIGFRRVEIVGHEWRVNGHKLRIRGVNRHEYHPDHGRVFDADEARAGLLLMKQHNINAVRTAHYPPHPKLLELTDELGFWVIDECDLETHGFEAGGWVDNPSDDPRWRAALLDRVERFFERDKNHPSVIAWSLGNEAGTGSNTAAMAAWLHRRDPERPVHYEPDFEGSYTDVVSRMYATIEEMEDMSEGTGNNMWGSPGRNAVLAKRPMILCEYAHAMGNGAGALHLYEERFNTLPQWHGGFVWEWRDHGLRQVGENGQEFFAYGGDFGEEIHDGSFVCDGMVLSDGSPTPMLAEFAAVSAPIKLAVDADVLHIENHRHAGETADLRFVVIDELDGVSVDEHIVDVDALAPGESTTVAIPAVRTASDGEVWRTVWAELTKDAAWANSGHVVAFDQIQLRDVVGVVQRSATEAPFRDGALVHVGALVLDASTGDVARLGEHEIEGPRLELWRAPIENDVLSFFPSYAHVEPLASRGKGGPAPSWAEQWRQSGLDRLQRRVLAVDVQQDHVRVLHRYSPAASRESVVVELVWRSTDGEVQLSVDAQPSTGWATTWPRFGLYFALPLEVSRAQWFGTGPHENYPDSNCAARVGRYSASLDDLIVDYAVPQESGHRAGLRWLSLPDLGLSVAADAVAGNRVGFALRSHNVHEVTAARHPNELPGPTATHLYLDVAQHGLGSRSCGPDVRPEYQLRPRAGQWSLRFALGDCP